VQLVIRVGVSFQGRGCNSELVEAVVRSVTPTPLRNPHPTGPVKECCGAARDIVVFILAGHNNPTYSLQYIEAADLEDVTRGADPVSYHEAWQHLCKSE